MKRYLYMGLILAFACSGKQTREDDNVVADSTTLTVERKQDATEVSKNPEAEAEEEDSGCVFNTDYKGLTTDWLKELGKKDFTWREDITSAVLVEHEDTIIVTKGGCNHSGLTVILKLASDNHSLSDSVFWMNKAIELSAEFGFDNYTKMLTDGKFRIASGTDDGFYFDVEDDNDEDNLFYNGVSINIEGKGKKIEISQYYN